MQDQMGMTPAFGPEGVQQQQAAKAAPAQQQGQSEKPAQAGQPITDWASI
jgi:hypothetical protein